MNHDDDNATYVITLKGEALMAYIGKQESAAESGAPESFEKAMHSFEQEIFAPIERYVEEGLVINLVEGSMDWACDNPEEPTEKEMQLAAYDIGRAVLASYQDMAEAAAKAAED